MLRFHNRSNSESEVIHSIDSQEMKYWPWRDFKSFLEDNNIHSLNSIKFNINRLTSQERVNKSDVNK